MSVEGNRRPGILEDNSQQHPGIFNSEAEVTENREMISVSDLPIALPTNTIIEKLSNLCILCTGLAFCCSCFVLIIYSLLTFVFKLAEKIPNCSINGTFYRHG